MYPFVFQQAKSRDQELLRQTLKPWETPFNCLANAGYKNMEPSSKGIPPLVSICSFGNINA
jgi:hypothetical protein